MSTTTEMNKRDGKESVIVVLDGMKVLREKTGVAPLRCALRDVLGPDDEVLVLTIIVSEAPTPPPSPSYCCIVDNHPAAADGDSEIKFLQQEITQKKEAYMQIFRPYYDTCKSNGVKFQVKIAASFQPKPIIEEDANNVKATLIIMDRCFASAQNFRLSGTQCNISVVSCDEEAVVPNCLPLNDISEPSAVKEQKPNPKLSKLKRKSLAQEGPHVQYTLPSFEGEYQHFPPSLVTSTSRGTEILTMAESPEESHSIQQAGPPTKGPVSLANISSSDFSESNLLQTMPLQLSWEVISDITGGFGNVICFNQNESFKTYSGYLA
ncbi:hypothetical protein F0562_000823 [Nyssa sinensis]|uniref:Uncharacterized protein n=1 Tax=Nyssa sinensis TaxID=561372 RepID=A0A5J5C1Q0_9ASTE|nr:hypothetical protein F0562_000823 [Nyssa sinensis]